MEEQIPSADQFDELNIPPTFFPGEEEDPGDSLPDEEVSAVEDDFMLPTTLASTSNKPMVGTDVKTKAPFVLSGAVTSSGVNTSLAGNASAADLASYTFNSNELHQNVVLRIWAAGDYTTDDATATVALALKVGSTTYHTITTTGATIATTPWGISWTIIISVIGSSGSAESYASAKTNNVNKDNRSATQTIDVTASQKIAINAAWTSGDAGDSITIRQFLVEVLY